MKTYSRLTLAFLLLILVVSPVVGDEPPENGKHVEYYDNGQKKEEGNYKNGKQDGLFIVWHENGQKKEEGHFNNGSPDGLWTLWDKDGNKTRVILFKDGEMVVLE